MTGAIAPTTGVDGVLAALPDNGSTSLVTTVVLLDPLTGPADSSAMLPGMADVAVYVAPAEGLPTLSGEPAFQVTAIAVGNVVFDLSDGYTLSIDEAQSAVFVANALTGESILVWGAAQIALDGADAARFWGTTSVELGNGTKITMETAVDAMIADLFRLDRLTVTQADRAMVITGISEETLGDLAVEQSMDGAAIDAETRDGLTLVTDMTGSWSDEFGNAVTQEILDQTAPGELYGPGRTTMSLREVAGAMWNFVTYNQIDSLMLTIGRNLSTDDQDRRSSPSADVYRALALYAGDSARFAAGT